MDESEIVRMYFSRDENALSATERQYGVLLKRLVFGILRSEGDCEECLSDVYFKLWSTIPPLSPDSLKAYALKVARSEALMKLRKKTAKKRRCEAEISLSELEDILPDKSAQDSSESEIREILNRFLGELDRDARIIFVRRYWYFDSVKEISLRFGFTQSKVKSSLRYTRERLRKFLIKEGVVL